MLLGLPLAAEAAGVAAAPDGSVMLVPATPGAAAPTPGAAAPTPAEEAAAPTPAEEAPTPAASPDTTAPAPQAEVSPDAGLPPEDAAAGAAPAPAPATAAAPATDAPAPATDTNPPATAAANAPARAADPAPEAPADPTASAPPPAMAGPHQPADTRTERCTADRRSCIKVASYVSDVCTVIERAATENRLDPNFLARLLWKESMFEPEAVSPVGAQGIAQFMPETARIRRLDDPFNPAKAIHASADYLRYLIDGFGNMGLAAVAYNGGEGRALRFYNGGQVLPYETQDYVEAITGHNAWKWRDEPPGTLDLRLDKDRPFREACIKLAGNRSLKEFTTKQRAWPWGVILASHPKQSGAQSQVSRLNRQLRPILGGKRVSYVRKTMTGSGRKVYTAQIGYSSRGEANAFCNQFRALGGRCIVLKN
ncbi:transglycosylase SLT domain-containing protein [Paracoccus panacisoli]|uniref:Transglycosylase SLT domain-containing protein n=1 Tax=Paracoccus panacisoli TaxID=1510163 RepID=A0ABV6T258_9RHOB